MADDPPQNNLHRYWHKKPPDAPAPAEDSTLGMLSSRLVSFSCCHSPSRSSYVDLLFGSTGAPAEIRLGQLDDVGARAAPADDSTQVVSSRLVSFSCCHSPSRSSYVDLLFGSTGAPAEIRLGQLDDVGARAAPARRIDHEVCYLTRLRLSLPTGTPLFDPSFVAGPPVDTILEPGGEGISAARGEHLLADGSCRLFCRRRPSLLMIRLRRSFS